MKKHPVTAVVASGFRINEGVTVGVSVKNEIKPDGSSRTVFGVDLNGAHVPERRYAAQVCEVVFERGGLRITFGQPSFARAKLRTALVLRINPIAARQLVDIVDGMRGEELDAVTEKLRLEPEELVSIDEEPDQVAEVIVNMAMVGIAGYETCVDFFHASPFGVKDMQATKKMAVEPVVRVDMRTAVFLSMMDAIGKIVADLPREAVPEE